MWWHWCAARPLGGCALRVMAVMRRRRRQWQQRQARAGRACVPSGGLRLLMPVLVWPPAPPPPTFPPAPPPPPKRTDPHRAHPLRRPCCRPLLPPLAPPLLPHLLLPPRCCCCCCSYKLMANSQDVSGIWTTISSTEVEPGKDAIAADIELPDSKVSERPWQGSAAQRQRRARPPCPKASRAAHGTVRSVTPAHHFYVRGTLHSGRQTCTRLGPYAAPRRPRSRSLPSLSVPPQWVLQISKPDGWRPTWFVPALVSVVLAAVAISLLLFAVLVSRCGWAGPGWAHIHMASFWGWGCVCVWGGGMGGVGARVGLGAAAA